MTGRTLSTRIMPKYYFTMGLQRSRIEKRPEAEELLRFNEILSQNREKIREEGGIERVVESAGIRHLRVKAIEYGLFRATEDDQTRSPYEWRGKDKKNSTIWGDFVRVLLDGTLDPSGERLQVTAEIDPAVLAQVINETCLERSRQRSGKLRAGDFFIYPTGAR